MEILAKNGNFVINGNFGQKSILFQNRELGQTTIFWVRDFGQNFKEMFVKNRNFPKTRITTI